MVIAKFPHFGDLSIVLGLVALIVAGAGALTVTKNGSVCNQSTVTIWITVTEVVGRRAAPLAPGECTNVILQDAEAIWGRTCSAETCTHKAWKVGAGRFEVHEHETDASGPVLKITGWGAGSRWQITKEWNRPPISEIGYSLSR